MSEAAPMPQIRISDHLCKMRGTNEISPVYIGMWNSRELFVSIKGGKGSGKSKTIALMWIYRLMKYWGSNLLVIRKVFDTLRTSCFNDLLWAINELSVQSLWKVTYSPMEMTYRPTNQKILFKGADKAEKVGSTSVVAGILCWCWFEEFYEISTEDEFDKIAFSIRGDLTNYPHLWFQIVCSMNPWSETWIKDRFFTEPLAPNVFSGTTTFRDNDKLNKEYIEMCENMYKTDPRRARVYCDGEFGISEGLIYSNWEVVDFNINEIIETHPNIRLTYGLDFGYAVSFNAFIAVAVDVMTRELWIFDEYYEHGVPNMDIAKAIIAKGYGKEQIWADAAEPKSIFELQTGMVEEIETGKFDDEGNPIVEHIKWQLPGIKPALKGPDSVRQGISTLQGFKMYVSPNCPNTKIELCNFCYDQDSEGKFTGKPIKEFDHCLVGDTLILTDHGEVPIRDIQNGDMVLTHMGLKSVISAGITQLNQEIWCLELTDGTVLEGTWNHPVVTVNGVKYLRDLSNEDIVIKHMCQSDGFSDTIGGIQCEKTSAIDFAHPPAKQNGVVTPDSITRQEFVNNVVKSSHATGISKQDFVPVSVRRIFVKNKREDVYDLTVDEAHDFFANGILTLNCMDALRYSMSKLFVRAKGHVAEAKGMDSLHSPTVPVNINGRESSAIVMGPKEGMPGGGHKRIRRVFSTH